MALSGGKTGRSSAEKRPVVIPHTRLDSEKQFDEIYQKGRELGSGSFGTVLKVRNKESGQLWACKCINKENKDSKVKMLLEWEIHILKKVQHVHIIRLKEVFETSKITYLIMEFCGGGNLKSMLETAEDGHFSEDDTKIVVQRLASALSYLHKDDIVHRDIKLENILLSENPADKDDRLFVKVTDFGLSIVKDGVGHDNMLSDICGTLIYMAPEIINNKFYSERCDVWALGVIMYMLLCGRPPFTSNDDTELCEIIRKADLLFKGTSWSSVSSEAKNCLRRMMQPDTVSRLTAGEVLQHAWITGKPLDGQPPNAMDLMKQMMEEDKKPTSSGGVNGENHDNVSNTCTKSPDSSSGPPSRSGSAEATRPGKSSGGSTRSALPKVPEYTKTTQKSPTKTMESASAKGSTPPTKNGQTKTGTSKSPVSRDAGRTGPTQRTKTSAAPTYHTARTTATKVTGVGARVASSNVEGAKGRKKIS